MIHSALSQLRPSQPDFADQPIREAEVRLESEALAAFDRAARHDRWSELTLLLSALTWYTAGTGEDRPVRVTVPGPDGAARSFRVPVDRTASLRAHVGAVKEQLTAALRGRRGTPEADGCDVYADVSGSEEPPEQAGVAVRYSGEGRMRVWMPAGPGSPEAVASAIGRFLLGLDEPETSLARIALLSDDERAQVLGFGTGRPMPEWTQTSLVELFRASALAFPHRTAVIDGERDIEYAELDADSDRIAHDLLTRHALEPGQVVAVALDNGIDGIRAMLGVLKARGVLLWLDPTWPEERLRALCADADARVVVTDAGPPPASLAPIPCLAIGAPSAGPAVNLPRVCPDDTAYLLYTSGSTGRPKGVLVGHGSLANMLRDQSAYVGVTQDDRVLQPFSPSFDVTMLATGAALVTGAAVVPGRMRHSTDDFAADMRGSGVTVAFLVPTLLRSLTPEDLPDAGTVISGGEPLQEPDVRRWCGAGRRLINSYGATETTCCTSASDVVLGGEITIGTPIANTWIRVLGTRGELMPIGAVGEICVEGAAVAQDYLHADAPPLAQPVPGLSGVRRYRTGDLGRWCADGRLELIGRRDRQVQIGGHRVEPAEVEAALLNHPGVDAAGVVVSQGRLCAFVAGDGVPDPRVLSAELSKVLPAHALPDRTVLLARLPETPGGKTDLEALTRLAAEEDDGESAGPQGPWEERLFHLWQELLEQAPAGVTDNFFGLGGTSLTALRMLSRLELETGVSVAVSTFFEAPTVRALAARCAEVLAAPAAAPETGATPESGRREDHDQPLPLSPGQLGVWLACARGEAGATYNVPRCFELTGALDVDALRAAVSDLGRRHGALRTTFTSLRGTPVQRVHAEPLTSLEILPAPPGPEERTALIDMLCTTPLSLETGPLLRVVLVEGEQSRTLVVIAHHIVCEGWSMGLLLGDLAALYEARTRGTALPRPPALPYQAVAERQSTQAHSERAVRQRAEWREHLSGARGVTFPAAPGPTAVSPASGPAVGGCVTRRFTSLDRDRLHEFARSRQTSAFAVVLAVVSFALREASGQEDVVVVSPVSLRGEPDLDDQIGVHLNMLPHRVATQGAHTMADIVARVRETVHWGLDRRTCPYTDMLADLGIPGAAFPVELDYRAADVRADPAEWALGDVIGRRLPRRTAVARKFGWDLLFTEDEQGLRLEALYDTAAHTESSAEGIVTRIARLLTDTVDGRDPALRAAPAAASDASDAATALAARRARLKRRMSGGSGADAPADVPARLPEPGQSIAERLDSDRELLDGLADHGGFVLYRDTGADSPERFREVLDLLGSAPLPYEERSSDRREVAPSLYTSTEHPADQPIKLHTEHSYAQSWPLRLTFCCIRPADSGGETTVADLSAITQRLRPETVARFRDEGVRYVRNFGGGLGLEWPTVFGTHDREEVEDYCRRHDIAYEWRGEDRLRTTFWRPALRTHPHTGREVWFNHAYFFSPSSLDPALRDELLDHCDADDLPFRTLYGGGQEIEDPVIEELGRAYSATLRKVRWQRGDVLIVDNMSAAHGRMPYQGRREVLVAMSHGHTPDPTT
ncbi:MULTISPECIES: AMP-binding protein [unclassified Streptomyces]|uniref:non-ribosomal peptide synthetase n=1 Tax=unclassified Streptomyces TaxID=2593676 RepID=UPI0037F5F0E5